MSELKTSMITGKVRFTFAHLFTPTSSEEGKDPKYSVVAIIPKSDTKTIDAINQCVKNALELGKTKHFEGKIPKNFKHPLRDGDEEREDYAEFKDCYFMNTSSLRKPGLVNASREDIIDKEEMYSGCYGRLDINFFAFAKKGNVGVGAGLNNVQKLTDGERLGGSFQAAADAFDDDFEDDGNMM